MRNDENDVTTAAIKHRWRRSCCYPSPSNTCVRDSPWPPCHASADGGATPKLRSVCEEPSTSSLSNCARPRQASKQLSEARRLKRRPLASRSFPPLQPQARSKSNHSGETARLLSY